MHIKQPTQIKAVGNLPKVIKEYFGYINSQEGHLSVAKMESPKGWKEPGQTPEFDEYTIVLKGQVEVETKEETYILESGQAYKAEKGKWVRYSTPQGAEYLAICLPAFHPDQVHRDQD